MKLLVKGIVLILIVAVELAVVLSAY